MYVTALMINDDAAIAAECLTTYAHHAMSMSSDLPTCAYP